MAYDFLYTHRLYGNDRRNYFGGYKIQSDQMTRERLQVVWGNLEAVLRDGPTGHIVELGCYVGTTSLFIRRQLDRYQQSSEREFHVYDSFVGLPTKTEPDTSPAGETFEPGTLRASKKDFLHEFKATALQPPTIHKAWFHELVDTDIPEPIAFAFLDGDFYASIIDSLRLVVPKLAPHAKLLIDDYKNVQLPGVERAINDYFRGKTITISEQHNIAVIQL